MKKRILMVNPSYKDTIFGKMKMLVLPPMGLAVLASRTPDDFTVTIIDENVDTLDFNVDVDLVAVTAATVQAPRAYEIIDGFKKRGTPTIMGGIHASVMRDEALRFADTVVIGEADELWPVILRDFCNGNLKQIYTQEEFPRLDNMPPISRDAFYKKYYIQSVQTSRGCPCDCSFCSVTKFNGKKYRFRPVDQVVAEIASIRDRHLFISDDSIVGLGSAGIDHARNLFAGMKGLGKTWGAQVCITIAEHEDLLRAARDAGATTFYIGFESIEVASLKSMNKGINLRPKIKDYKDTIRKFHNHGISIIGGFILGTDTDTHDSFQRTIEFIHDSEIDGCQFTIMTPFPGTKLYAEMEKEKRLLYTSYPDDWARYNAYEAVIEPKNMKLGELMIGQQQIYSETASIGRSLVRGLKTLRNTKSSANALTNFLWNYTNYRAIKNINARRFL